MSNPLQLIIELIFDLAILLFLLRFLLQACGADFYNQLSQAVVKATDPICKPLRKLLKPIGRWDMASFVVAWLIAIGVTYVDRVVMAPEYVSTARDVLSIVIGGFFRTLLVAARFYWWFIIILVIASFVAQGTRHPALVLIEQLVDPLVRPVRNILPNFGPLDLSPMLVLILLYVAQSVLIGLAY